MEKQEKATLNGISRMWLPMMKEAVRPKDVMTQSPKARKQASEMKGSQERKQTLTPTRCVENQKCSMQLPTKSCNRDVILVIQNMKRVSIVRMKCVTRTAIMQ